MSQFRSNSYIRVNPKITYLLNGLNSNSFRLDPNS